MNRANEQNLMKRSKWLSTLALAAIGATACEDITNPVEEFGELTDPFVRFVDSEATGTPGSVVLAIFQMPTAVEENVEVDYTFGGDAVFDQDFQPVDLEDGDPRTDVTAAGGTAQLEYEFDNTSLSTDTLGLFVPLDAVDGRSLEIELTEARTATGTPVQIGLIESHRVFRMVVSR